MDKQSTIEAVKTLIDEGQLTRPEVLELFEEKESDTSKTGKLVEILYYIGGAIVGVGVAVLIGQNWDQLPSVARLLSTLGAGVAAYVVAVLFSSRSEATKVANAFWLIAAVITPIGLNVAFHEAGYRVSEPSVQSVIFALLFTAWLLSYVLYRRVIILTFTFIFGISLYYVFTSFLLSGRPVFDEPTFTEYRTLAAGVALCLFGYYFRTSSQKALSGTLYGFGALAFLGSALALGGYKPEQSVAWEIVFPILTFLFILGSVSVKSKSFLVMGSLFLMAYIGKITTEYFSDSLGWPLALVIAGLCIIGIGYASFTISKKYLGART
jgi:hypothetical protein